MRRYRLSGVGSHEQRVAILRRFSGNVGRDRIGGAGPVLDNERLFERVTEFFSEHARHDIGAAAGRRTDHNFYRPCRILRLRGCGGACTRYEA